MNNAAEELPDLLEILQVPDKRLRQVAAEVDHEYMRSGRIFTLLARMKEHLEANGGIGLAAPQIGELRRVIVVKTLAPDGKTQVYNDLINPVIVNRRGKESMVERCLSVDYGKTGYVVKRAKSIIVRAMAIHQPDPDVPAVNLVEIVSSYKGLDSTVIQHEIDHLNGKTIKQTGKRVDDALATNARH